MTRKEYYEKQEKRNKILMNTIHDIQFEKNLMVKLGLGPILNTRNLISSIDRTLPDPGFEPFEGRYTYSMSVSVRLEDGLVYPDIELRADTLEQALERAVEQTKRVVYGYLPEEIKCSEIYDHIHYEKVDAEYDENGWVIYQSIPF